MREWNPVRCGTEDSRHGARTTDVLTQIGTEACGVYARLGGLSTLARYGRNHFAKIRKLRKSYPKYKAGYTVREMKAWSKHLFRDMRSCEN